MGLLLNVVMKNAQDHPGVDLTYCVNYRQRRFECRECVRICPRQVYDKNLAVPPKWDQCQSCGLCVTACPSRCIVPPPLQIKRHLLLADRGGETTVSCERSENRADHVEACIAQMPWELLACLALGGRLQLDMQACNACPYDDCRKALEQQLQYLKAFLGKELWEKHVSICKEQVTDAQEKHVSRRGLFSGMARSGKKAGALALADAMQEGTDGLIYRRLLLSRVRTLESQGKKAEWRLRMPWFSDKCYGCGICEKLCPNRAIEISAEKEGMRSIFVQPYKCTGCGVCAQVCRWGGIEEICLVRTASLERVRMKQVKSASCMRCGRAIAPDAGKQYCAVCAQKTGCK